jgi:tetratricopeptide (TPR) repeat protein
MAVVFDREKILQAARKLIDKRRNVKAIDELERLGSADLADARTQLVIGDLHFKLERYADAIATYERAALLYSSQGSYAKTIAVYEQIREIVRKHVPHLEDRLGHVVAGLAESYLHLGLVGDALTAYDELAARYQRAGRDREAIEVLRTVVALDPQRPMPLLRLAEALLRIDDVDAAVLAFAAAAEMLRRLGRRDDALRVVERLLSRRAAPRLARLAAEVYLERGELADAMSALANIRICIQEDPRDLGALALLARAFDLLAQPARSIEVQKEAARIAQEAGERDYFCALVDALLARAPADQSVRRLAAMRERGPDAGPACEPHAPLPSHCALEEVGAVGPLRLPRLLDDPLPRDAPLPRFELEDDSALYDA